LIFHAKEALRSCAAQRMRRAFCAAARDEHLRQLLMFEAARHDGISQPISHYAFAS